ncbi:MAG: bifunctional diaminohydroxyphosphoribosylaminopyrimidine deaminase/5-amino-6-(5-phosphoribosylamino)uracil reductase RibD [Calditrichaeota bacterium]|nr:bifunctional diaminohydroxyphosphoribosylaminopyrimidine deaminase/5-amino-6-(5-phosphoribosylamino)uracil reductase RibD [Calditrichota bacterium]
MSALAPKRFGVPFFDPSVGSISDIDYRHIRRTFRLAYRGNGAVSPNPRVGAVLVGKEDKVLAEGYHHRFGERHAEVDALTRARVEGQSTSGSTLYINLEPCAHVGRQPPCCDAIIKAGVRRVVASVFDPNPVVNGAGFAALRKAGIEVLEGIGRDEARYLNRGYFSWREKGRAWCTVKIALSIDGKMASYKGESKWISSDPSRRLAHRLRADHDAVLIGRGTLEIDDPELTVRMVKGPQPVRIILAPHRVIDPDSRIGRTIGNARTMQVVLDAPDRSYPALPKGVLPLPIKPGYNGFVDPAALLSTLPSYNILSVLVEGGSRVISAFLESGVIDELMVAYAPSVIGRGIAPFDHFAPPEWDRRPAFVIHSAKRFGPDLVVTYRPQEAPRSPA